MDLSRASVHVAAGTADAATDDFRKLARNANPILEQGLPDAVIEEALRIRVIEQKLLSLFAAGQMNGTVHTCVGQEFSAVAVAGQALEPDWITSNHRCHGHFIARTKNWRGLLDELMGLDSGVCRGIGSSQHLYAKGFLSNGLQGAFVPVATGIALHHKRRKLPGISISFIGEGTLGEGVLYEAMNVASVLKVPHLIVCENNLYSQSTPQITGIAGEIAARPRAFGLEVFEGDTWNVANLMKVARDAIQHVRKHSVPAFLIVRTYRLNAHSKGDDDRNPAEIAFFREHDPITKILEFAQWRLRHEQIVAEVDEHVAGSDRTIMDFGEYCRDQLPQPSPSKEVELPYRRARMVQALNQAYRTTLEEGAIHLGEDIHDPYGGAFKVTKGLMDSFPDSVYTMPISEAAIVGVATGAALMGTPSYAEIMFGDFITNAFDQLVNNLAKIRHMYAFQASAPARIRTPMGGKRGYGPTHSQSLEKFLVGIDNIATVYLSSLMDPAITIREVAAFECPAILLENKVDYGRFLWECPPYLEAKRESRAAGSLRISPRLATPTVTIASYGETARELADILQQIFVETDQVPELIVLLMLHPLDIEAVVRSVQATRQLVVVEDGSVPFGIGGEILARIAERGIPLDRALRIGAEPVPIPSAGALELQALPSRDRVLGILASWSSK